MARFDLKYSDVRILSSALQRKAEYTYMNTRQKTKGGTSTFFTSLHKLQQFRLQNTMSHLAFLANALSTSFVGQCSRWHCSKRSASSQSSVMVERIDVSVRYNLKKTRSDSDIVTISVPMISTQHSVDVWKLDTATTAECCRSIVRAMSCCSCCPLLTPENMLAAKISWTIGGGHRAARL